MQLFVLDGHSNVSPGCRHFRDMRSNVHDFGLDLSKGPMSMCQSNGLLFDGSNSVCMNSHLRDMRSNVHELGLDLSNGPMSMCQSIRILFDGSNGVSINSHFREISSLNVQHLDF